MASFNIVLQTRGSLHPDGEPTDFVSEYTGVITCTDDETGAETKVGKVAALRVHAGLAHNAGESLFDVCDGHSDELHHLHTMLYEPDCYHFNDDIMDTLAAGVIGLRFPAWQMLFFEHPGRRTSPMQVLECPGTIPGLLFAVHIQRQPLFQMAFGSHAVDTLLGLAKTAIRPLHRITRRSQQLVIQKQQRLLQTRAEQLGQRSTQLFETPNSVA